MDKIKQDMDKLSREQVKVGIKVEEIIREQERVVTGAEKGIERLNSDIRATRKRLDKYVNGKGHDIDDKYFTLKDEYAVKLQERVSLEKAMSIAEESITAAKLHMIPGE